MTIQCKGLREGTSTAEGIGSNGSGIRKYGALLFGLDSNGKESLMPTPHGMLPGLDEATVDDLQLRPIMNELKSRGLVQLSGAIEGPPKWRVTKAGAIVGLDSKTDILADVLFELGIDRELIDAAFLSFQTTPQNG